MIRGVLLDLAGVLYDGAHVVPGSVAAVKQLRDAGLPLRFVTNSTRASRRVLLNRLRGFGFDVSENELFTPASAACAVLEQRNLSAHLLIHPDLAEDFADVSCTGDGTAVVVGDAGEFFTFDALNTACRELLNGAELFALATNRVFLDSDGELSIDAGAFIAALKYATGKKPVVLGKPAPGFFGAALASMEVAAQDAVMVGDDVESDVAGALRAGLGQAVLVKTGKYRQDDEMRTAPEPSYLAADLEDAVSWLLHKK